MVNKLFSIVLSTHPLELKGKFDELFPQEILEL